MIWINGKYYRDELAKVSVLDRGFLYGDGLLETLAIYNHVPFCLPEHLERLFYSLKIMKIKIPYSKKELTEVIHELIQRNKVRESALRIIVSRGMNTDGFAFPKNAKPTVAITFRQVPKSNGGLGISAIVSAIIQNKHSLFTQLKTCNGLPYIFALNQAHEAGADEAILLNTSGHIAECAMHNIFWIRGKIIYTPKIECGVLPGITRNLVLKLAKTHKIQCKEVAVPISVLFNAHEAFVTNSVRGIQPLVRINKRKIGDGKQGRITMELQTQYHVFMMNACQS